MRSMSIWSTSRCFSALSSRARRTSRLPRWYVLSSSSRSPLSALSVRSTIGVSPRPCSRVGGRFSAPYYQAVKTVAVSHE